MSNDRRVSFSLGDRTKVRNGVSLAHSACSTRREELDAGSDVVNVGLESSRNVVFITANVLLAAGPVLVVVILGLEESFHFLDLGIELNPALVRGLGDLLCRDVGFHQPGSNAVDGLLGWSEEFGHLIGSVVLAIVRGVMAGAVVWN